MAGDMRLDRCELLQNTAYVLMVWGLLAIGLSVPPPWLPNHNAWEVCWKRSMMWCPSCPYQIFNNEGNNKHTLLESGEENICSHFSFRVNEYTMISSNNLLNSDSVHKRENEQKLQETGQAIKRHLCNKMSFKNPMPMQPKTGNIQTFRVTC
jgi:hypothetical protein